mmetsp:Transcript_18339/g.42276  ORF Transcript_18339/g.42276 Transcript_18339/m.42276 type:complete len:102 (+) Transcript_18339:775-1080(+)
MKEKRRQAQHTDPGIQFANFATPWNRSGDVVCNDIEAVEVALAECQGRKVEPSEISNRKWLPNEFVTRQPMPVARIPRKDVVAGTVVAVTPQAVPQVRFAF